MHFRIGRREEADYVRNFIFGVEDSLVSTAGFVSGIAFAGLSTRSILLAGIVLIFVEAFSMAIGAFLAEKSAEEFETRREVSNREPMFDALIMFFSYVISGLLVLAPYLFADTSALTLSIVVALVLLFILGMISAKLAHTKIWKHGIIMFFIGGTAILLGTLIGQLLKGV